MARQLSTLDPEPWYRAVVFFKYSGAHGMDLKTYTDIDGVTYNYHTVRVFGPYEKPGTAKSLVKREKRHAEQGYSDWYNWSAPVNQRKAFKVADVEGIVEVSTPVWGFHA